MSNANTDKKTSNSKLNELEQVKKFTTVVADTADFESIHEFKPQDWFTRRRRRRIKSLWVIARSATADRMRATLVPQSDVCEDPEVPSLPPDNLIRAAEVFYAKREILSA